MHQPDQLPAAIRCNFLFIEFPSSLPKNRVADLDNFEKHDEF
jgi:hypothetical protein